jgi:ubiquitin-conjugating enzyme E2 G1
MSVISLLSSETPNLDSPANVDAAKEVRTDFAGPYQCLFRLFPSLTDIVGYKKKIRRLVRRSAEEAFE